jgi:tellurite resistance protein TerA
MRIGWSSTMGENDESGMRPTQLTAAMPSVSLTQRGMATGMFRANLTWDRMPMIPTPRAERGRRLLPQRLEPPPLEHGRLVDLDLACFYEFTTGQRGVVQALGHRRGSYERPPYIRLDQDDRSGSATGENIFVNLDHAEAFSRILIFVFAYAGAFQGANAKVTFLPNSGTPLEIALDSPTPDARACAVAMLYRQGSEIMLQREMFYTSGFQSELDRQYGWGMRWQEGQKSG